MALPYLPYLPARTNRHEIIHVPLVTAKTSSACQQGDCNVAHSITAVSKVWQAASLQIGEGRSVIEAGRTRLQELEKHLPNETRLRRLASASIRLRSRYDETSFARCCSTTGVRSLMLRCSSQPRRRRGDRSISIRRVILSSVLTGIRIVLDSFRTVDAHFVLQ
jgi:hypothetical protein